MEEERLKLLHTAIQEFFQLRGYEESLSVYTDELSQNEISLDSSLPSIPGDEVCYAHVFTINF